MAQEIPEKKGQRERCSHTLATEAGKFRDGTDAQPVSTRSLANMTAMTWSQFSKRAHSRRVANL